MNPYNLVEVRFKKTVVHARPVEFVFDTAGQPIKATKLVTTCPNCGAYNEIDVSTIIITEDVILNRNCSQCESVVESIVYDPAVSTEKIEVKPVAALVKQNDVKREGISGKELVDINDEGFTTNSVFVDPVALGNFEIEDL